jgi:hypothetical protein
MVMELDQMMKESPLSHTYDIDGKYIYKMKLVVDSLLRGISIIFFLKFKLK